MKRYLIFTYDNYYPMGGFEDFKCDFDSKEEVVKYIKERNLEEEDYLDIVDIETRMMWHFHRGFDSESFVQFMQDSERLV